MRLLTLIAVFAVFASLASAAAVNLAIHKPAAQSSTYQNDPNYAASKGVDGSKNELPHPARYTRHLLPWEQGSRAPLLRDCGAFECSDPPGRDE